MKGDQTTVLGFNLGTTRLGQRLRDGAACIIKDGEVEVAIAEERVTRDKYTGGFQNSLRYCLENADLDFDQLDKIVYSTCVEGPYRPDVEATLDASPGIIEPVSHHLSHAHSAFDVSGFDEAIVLVIDAGGNLLEAPASDEWWKEDREQHSYYVAEDGQITLLGRDFSEPYEAGAGEIYRAFTHYLGFKSHVHSGKIMALAAYGDRSRYSDGKIFELNGDEFTSRIRNTPKEPIEMVSRFAENEGLDFGKPRQPGDSIQQIHKDIASFVQRELERLLISTVNKLCEKRNIRNVVFAGGVAKNCVANRRVLQETPITGFFVQPAAGDQGQALGNALYGYKSVEDSPQFQALDDVFFGRFYTNQTWNKLLNDSKLKYQVLGNRGAADRVANALTDGDIVAVFQNGSEYGPRALGHRSILADPRDTTLLKKLHRIKSREPYRPFAPSILEGYIPDWFEESWLEADSEINEKLSPYMIVTGTVKQSKRELVPCVTHTDGSARLQAVSKSRNLFFHKIIQKYYQKTGIPMVLNTSFNRGGEPIVETPKDALACCRNTEIDLLVTDNFVVGTSQSRLRKQS